MSDAAHGAERDESAGDRKNCLTGDRRRVRLFLDGGHMDVSLAPDTSPETVTALCELGQAAVTHMKEKQMTDLIGKKATIVGYSETGDALESGTEFVAHVCLDIEDGPRVFFQATDPEAVLRVVEEPR